MPSPSNERLFACHALTQVLLGKGSLASHLNSSLKNNTDLNTALIQEYCFGVSRWYHQLNSFSQALLEKPLRKKDLDIQCLILLGLYQLFFMRTPAHATVNETVAACLSLNKPWAKGLINAVLREAQRKHEQLLEASAKDYVSFYSHPEWLLKQLKTDWPANYRTILENNNKRAPMTLRVNTSLISRQDYLALLQDLGITANPGALTPSAIVLEAPTDVRDLPGFEQGQISVQDEASQLLPTFLSLSPGMKVLDACAAPGGKSIALLESEPALEILCLDNDSKRLPRLQENLARSGFVAEIRCADIAQEKIAENESFDLILLDVPCSATGVIRRHPDIKLLRSAKDVDELVVAQQRLLSAAWPLLRTGGKLMYSTCSVLQSENTKQIAAFISSHSDAVEHKLALAQAIDCEHGKQLLPIEGAHDGFYYALLEKH